MLKHKKKSCFVVVFFFYATLWISSIYKNSSCCDRYLNTNTSIPKKSDETEGGISKESIAQANPTPTAPPTAAVTQAVHLTTSPTAHKAEVNDSSEINPWAERSKESIDSARKPDLKPFKDEVEEDAVVAENEADKQALLKEIPAANKTEAAVDEESNDAIDEDIPSQTEVFNVSPPRPKLVTPFRGRCPVCREY